MRLSLEENDGESGLPVVCMQNRRRLQLQDFKDGPGEEDKPLGIVGVVPLWRTIKAVPVEVLVGTDEIDGDSASLSLSSAAFLLPCDVIPEQ